MSQTNSNPKRRRARNPEGEFRSDDPNTTDIDEAWEEVPSGLNPKDFELPESIPTEPIRKPAGKPQVRNRVAKPRIGAVDKVTEPTFGVVRGVYH